MLALNYKYEFLYSSKFPNTSYSSHLFLESCRYQANRKPAGGGEGGVAGGGGAVGEAEPGAERQDGRVCRPDCGAPPPL